ncbi:MAG: hypothetical protein QXZ44_02590 [Ferroplasma sp.]
MNVVSTLGKMHEDVIGYGYEDFINYVTTFSFNSIFIAYVSEDIYNKDPDNYKELQLLDKKYELLFPAIDFKGYDKLLGENKLKVSTPEDVTKKNISDIIETVIYSYLRGYWKDCKTVNSSITDSIYRIRNQFLMQINPNYISNYWEPLHNSIFDCIKKIDNNALIISKVEDSFFYRDKI